MSSPDDRSDVRLISDDGAAAPGPKLSHNWTAFATLVILAAGLVVYSNTFASPFIFDDEISIINNETIRRLWPIWDVLAAKPARPIVNLSFAVNYAISEMDVWSYHAFNLVVHILAGWTLFGLVRRTLRSERLAGRFGRAAEPLALVVALLWLMHPLTTAAVTYITQRAESMMSLFYLLTIYCAARALDSPRRRWWYAAAIAASALGMGCKQVMVTAPVMVLLYDRTFRSGSFRGALKRHWPMYLGLAATWTMLIPSLFLLTGHVSAGYTMKSMTVWQYARSQPGVILHYLDLAFWPKDLCLDYTWRVAETARQIVPPAIVIGALLMATLWALWRRSPVGFLGAWFFLILAPSSSILPIMDLAFEHRVYLPLAAVVALVVFVGYQLGGSTICEWFPQRYRRQAGCALGVVVVLAVGGALGARTYLRNEDYSSTERMWRDVIAKSPRNFRAYHNLGSIQTLEGRYDEAIESYKKAVQIWPAYATAHLHLAEVYRVQGKLDEALKHYKLAEQNAEWLDNPADLATIYKYIGSILQVRKRIDEAVSYYQRSLEIKRDDPVTLCRLGIAYAQLGQHERAVELCREALRLSDKFAQAHHALGASLAALGRYREALGHLQRAAQLDPKLPGIHYDLGMVLAQLGYSQQAVVALETAVRRQPRNAVARTRLGLLYAQMHNPRGAVGQLRRALQLNPRDLVAANALAWIIATSPDAALRDGPEAVRLAERLCQATQYNQPELLDTLAAAYAEAGRYDDAVRVATQALQAASSAGKGDLVEQIRARLSLYKQHKPYRSEDSPRK